MTWLEVTSTVHNHSQILKQPEAFEWKPFDKPIVGRSNSTYIVRFKLNSPPEFPLALRMPFQPGAPGEDYKAQVYARSSTQFTELKPVYDFFTTVIVSPEQQVEELYYVVKIGIIPLVIYQRFSLVDQDTFTYKHHQARSFISAMAGAIALMILYNFGSLLIFRKSYMVYYLLYSIGVLYWIYFMSGMINYNNLTAIILACIPPFAFGSAFMFLTTVLQTRRNNPRLFKLGASLVALHVINNIFMNSGYEFLMKSNYGLLAIGGFYGGWITLLGALRGSRPSFTMLVGWIFIALSILSVTITLFLPNLPSLVWTVPLAAVLEIACFSFAMGQELRQSEMRAQKQNEHAFQEMSKMIYPHQLNRIRSGDILEATMPTMSGRGIVICLDIISSSQITGQEAKTFFRTFFARCNELMGSGYNGRDMTARAYRIKELGDGFLCSIGYPFTSPCENPAEDAVNLAKDFAMALTEVAEASGLHRPVLCGIGIAEAGISGFYPESGTKGYDLFGPAITLAKRYEEMRKVLFPQGLQASILILQEGVYLSLSSEMRQGLECIHLKERNSSVRDDPDAQVLFLQMLETGSKTSRVA